MTLGEVVTECPLDVGWIELWVFRGGSWGYLVKSHECSVNAWR